MMTLRDLIKGQPDHIKNDLNIICTNNPNVNLNNEFVDIGDAMKYIKEVNNLPALFYSILLDIQSELYRYYNKYCLLKDSNIPEKLVKRTLEKIDKLIGEESTDDTWIKKETHSFYGDADKFLTSLKERLVVKGKEYAVEGDPFYNFKDGEGFIDGDKKEVLWNYMAKHLVSVKNHCTNKIPLTEEQLDEKLGDIISYCTLLRFI